MSIFGNLFGGGASGGIAHGGGTSVQLPPMQQGAPAPAPAAAPAAPAAPAEESQSSHLDKLQAFWDTPKDAEGKPVAAPQDPLAQSIYNFDPAKVQESSRRLNFAGDIDPAQIDKALGGDKEAFLSIINQTTQNAFAAATLNTGKLINDSHATNNGRMKSALPTHIKQVQLSQTETTNPILQHPAAQPLVSALKSMTSQRDPSLSPNEITARVEALLVGLGTAIADGTPERQQQQKQAAAGEQDWSAFLDGR